MWPPAEPLEVPVALLRRTTMERRDVIQAAVGEGYKGSVSVVNT